MPLIVHDIFPVIARVWRPTSIGDSFSVRSSNLVVETAVFYGGNTLGASDPQKKVVVNTSKNSCLQRTGENMHDS